MLEPCELLTAGHPAPCGGTEACAQLRLASTLANVERVERTALHFATRAGFDADTASNIAMVTREAAVNAVLHGNRGDDGKVVISTFLIESAQLSITVSDQGEGLDPDLLPDPREPENLLRCSGRGVFLMRALMDEVHFRQLSPGTEIRLVKWRPAHTVCDTHSLLTA